MIKKCYLSFLYDSFKLFIQYTSVQMIQMVNKYQIPGWLKIAPWVLFWQQRALQERAAVAMANPVTAKAIKIWIMLSATRKIKYKDIKLSATKYQI